MKRVGAILGLFGMLGFIVGPALLMMPRQRSPALPVACMEINNAPRAKQ